MRKDREHEKELEAMLLGGWNLCFASESVDMRGQADNYTGGTKQRLAIKGQSLFTSSYIEVFLRVANTIQRLHVFTE